jgi:hypothetical protein
MARLRETLGIVDLEGLAGHVDAEVFRRACERAGATAAGTGRRPSPSRDSGAESGPGPGPVLADRTELTDVPHELADLVEGDLTPRARSLPGHALLREPHVRRSLGTTS